MVIIDNDSNIDDVDVSISTEPHLPESTELLLSDDVMDDSNDSIFPGLQKSQPESTSTQPTIENTPQIPLAQLANAKEIFPLPTVITGQILDEKTRSRCLLELSDENTFLTDISINAFCVSC